jgi:hypothetical protein
MNFSKFWKNAQLVWISRKCNLIILKHLFLMFWNFLHFSKNRQNGANFTKTTIDRIEMTFWKKKQTKLTTAANTQKKEKKQQKAAGEDTTCGRPLCNSERTVGSLSFRFRPEVEPSGALQQQVKALGRPITVITRLIIDLTRWLLFVLCLCSTGPECVCLFNLFYVDLHGFYS